MTKNAHPAYVAWMENILNMQRAWVRSLKEYTGKSYTRLAREAGLQPSTLNKPMNQDVSWNISATTLYKLADAHAYPLPATLQAVMAGGMVRLVGELRGGLIVALYDESDVTSVPMPAGVEEGPLQAIEVPDNKNWPIFPKGSIIYCDANSSEIVDNEEYYVVTAQKDRLIRWITNGSRPGRYHLHAVNAPPMNDVRIQHAFRIRWVKRG